MNNCIIIPARIESSRLPEKVLLYIDGKTMIHRVYEQCIKVKGAKVFIATDSKKIKKACSIFTNNIIITRKKHSSGTDRVAEAINSIPTFNYIVNVQADEPFIDPLLISNLFDELASTEIKIVSAMHKISKIKDLQNTNVVKVVVDNKYNALYFSRASIPYLQYPSTKIFSEKEISTPDFPLYKHVGVYGFQRDFLIEFSTTQRSFLEKLEGLEQLRVLENGVKIKMIETKYNSFGIDSNEDYLKAIKLYKQKQSKQKNG